MARIGVIKGDDLGVLLMAEELAVGFQDVLVVTEDLGQAPHPLSMKAGHLDNPLAHDRLVERRHHGIALKHVVDFGHFLYDLKNGRQR